MKCVHSLNRGVTTRPFTKSKIASGTLQVCNHQANRKKLISMFRLKDKKIHPNYCSVSSIDES